jgi:hypothetical protein
VRDDWKVTEAEQEAELLTLAPPTAQSPSFGRFIALWLGARPRPRVLHQTRHLALLVDERVVFDPGRQRLVGLLEWAEA